MIDIYHKIVLKFFYRSSINLWLGRIFFYNGGGFLAGVIGAYVKKRDSLRSQKLGFRQTVNETANILKDKGFFVFNDISNHQTIKSLASAWDDHVNKQDFPADGRLQLSSAEISREECQFSPLLEKLISQDIQDTLECYYGGYSRIINYHIYRNKRPANSSKLKSFGATANWHTDGSTSESIKLFFMLSDVTERNGPMEIISKKDTQNVIRGKQFDYPDHNGKTENYINEFSEPVSLKGNAGSAFYALTNDVMHRATIPNEGETRDLIVFYITSSSKKRTVSQQLQTAKYREIYGLERLYIN